MMDKRIYQELCKTTKYQITKRFYSLLSPTAQKHFRVDEFVDWVCEGDFKFTVIAHDRYSVGGFTRDQLFSDAPASE